MVLVVLLLHLVDDCRDPPDGLTVHVGHEHFSLRVLIERVFVGVELQSSHRVQRENDGGVLLIKCSSKFKKVASVFPIRNRNDLDG